MFALEFLVVALVTATWVVAFAVTLAVDGAQTSYALLRRRSGRGLRTTRVMWRLLWRMHLQACLGPRPSEVRSLSALLTLSPAEFEAATATVFRRLGYRQVRLVGRAGDYCVDVCATDRDGRSTVIQCKRYAPGNRVGSREVQTFVGIAMVHHRADRGVFVTTSSFTAGCWTIARESRGRITLIDGEHLGRIVAHEPRPQSI